MKLIPALAQSIWGGILLFQLSACGPFEKGQEKKKETLINLQAYGSKYVCADLIRSDTIIADREVPQDWEKFYLAYLSADQVALRSFQNNKYLSVDQNSKYLIANKDTIGESSRFQLIKIDDKYYAFKSFEGNYISADQTLQGRLIANRQERGDWEQFRIIDLSSH
jgi:hypothetical protein